MSGFLHLLERWELAETAAARAEARLSRRLDGYCEGWGTAPSIEEITAAQRRRAAASALLASLQAQLASAREDATVL